MQKNKDRERSPAPAGTAENLAWLRGRLASAGYTEEVICERLSVPSPAMLEPHQYPAYRLCLNARDPISLLIRLFMLQESVSEEEVQTLLGDDAPERLIAMGLLGRHGDGPPGRGSPSNLRARVDLYPYSGIWVATDRSDRCRELGGESLPDAVMELNLSSHALARVTLPITPGSRVLDLGTGCGLHALRAARAGAIAVGTDLNPRALAFARFNAALNALENVSFFEGDLYAPVKGERFDHILVNPAFILGPEARVLFRDGGPRGDAMSRRAIEGTAEHLTPGGIAQVVGEFPTIDGEAFEERVAAWVAGHGCDLLVLRFSTVSAAEYATLYSQEPFGQSQEAYDRAWSGRWEAFTSQGITEVAFGAVLMRRMPDARPWSIARAASLENPLGERLREFLTILDRLEDPSFPTPEDLPRMNPGVLLLDGLHWDGEQWQEEEVHASLPGDPLLPEAILPPGARALLLLCDGTRTIGEILAAVAANSDPADGVEAAAHQALRTLIEAGLIDV